MTVAEASLKNLIPQPRNWPEFTTTPIRVPTELKNWVLDMISQKVEQLRFSIGNTAPTEQSEQEWINEVCGLPAEYQAGDPLPEAIVAEIAEARSQNEAAAAKVESAAAKVESAAAKVEPAPAIIESEPPEYTQAWIDYMEAEPNPHGWNWQTYLAALREEARNGDPGANEDLEQFRSNGVDVGARFSNKQLVEIVRRQFNQAKKQSRNAAVVFGGAATVKLSHTGSGQKRKNKKLTKYQRIYERYDQLQTDCDNAYKALCAELNEKCLPGKNAKYHNFLEKWKVRELVRRYPNEKNFNNQHWLQSDYYAIRKAVCCDLAAIFYRPDKSMQCNDNRFVSVVSLGLTCWERAVLEIESFDSEYPGEYSE